MSENADIDKAGLLEEALSKLIEQIPVTITNKKRVASANNNPQFPEISRDDLIADVQDVLQCVQDHRDVVTSLSAQEAQDLTARIEFARVSILPQIWGAAHVAVPAFLVTLDAVKKWVIANSVPEDGIELAKQLKEQGRRIRSLEATLNNLEPRSSSLAEMLIRIENAHETAEQLPADMELLEEARLKIRALRDESVRDEADVKKILEEARTATRTLTEAGSEAKSVLDQCQRAYSSATSVGLAAAFSERSRSLGLSLYVWVLGLVVALVCAGYFGSSHVEAAFKQATAPEASKALISLNLLLTLFSVGAPIWFAWLSTKQIGQRFRLAEDYAFKASISRAYEGYRREAARIDPALESQLLQSALSRLDELPLRLVEEQSHGSPWGELLNSPVVRDAMKTVPEFASAVKDLASSKLRLSHAATEKETQASLPTTTVLSKD